MVFAFHQLELEDSVSTTSNIMIKLFFAISWEIILLQRKENRRCSEYNPNQFTCLIEIREGGGKEGGLAVLGRWEKEQRTSSLTLLSQSDILHIYSVECPVQ